MDKKTLESILDDRHTWSESNETILQKPYSHISQQEGKKFRLNLIETFNMFYNIPRDKIVILSKIIDVLHNSSLLIDDIEDDSPMRRGVKASHMIYGIPMTINSANYMYFKAMELIPELALMNDTNYNEIDTLRLEKSLMTVFQEELANLHRGQGMDIYWRDNNIIPSVNMYFEMVINKTGGLFRLSVRLMETLSKWYKENDLLNSKNYFLIEHSLVPLCDMLGIIYQIRDDYLNLVDDTMVRNKGFAEDITEGKLSFPIIHGLECEKIQISNKKLETPFLWNTLLSRTDNIDEKRKFIKILQEQTGSLRYSKETLQNMVSLIKERDYFPSLKENHDINKEAVTRLEHIVSYLSTV